MDNNKNTLRIRAIDLLAQGISKDKVSKDLGVHVRTVFQWISKPLFKDAVEKRAAELAEIVRSDSNRKITGFLALADHALLRALSGEFGGNALINAVRLAYTMNGRLKDDAVVTKTEVDIVFGTLDADPTKTVLESSQTSEKRVAS